VQFRKEVDIAKYKLTQISCSLS